MYTCMHTHTHTHAHTVIYQRDGTEKKIFKKRDVFKEDLKELAKVE